MTAPSPSLLLAACAALEVRPVAWPDGRLELTGPTTAVHELAPLIRAQRAAVVAELAAHTAAAIARQRVGFRRVSWYDVARDVWGEITRDDPRTPLNDCRHDPQRAAILAALDRALADAPAPIPSPLRTAA